MITVEAHNNIEPGQWAGIVSGVGGNPFHSREVLLAAGHDEHIVHLVFKKGAAVVGACIGANIERTRFGIIKGPKSLYLSTVPAFADGVVTREELYAGLLDFAGRSKYKTIEIEARWGDDFRAFGGLDFTVEKELLDFTIDLTRDFEELTKAIHQKHRKNIRKASEALQIEEDGSLEAFNAIRTLQQGSSERASERGNEYAVQDEDYFRKIYDKVYKNGPGRVMLAKKDGVNVAGFAYLVFCGKAVTSRSGATKAGYDTMAMHLIQYEILKRLKQEGVREINIGGVPAEAAEPAHVNHGLYNFKRYFGAQAHLRTGVKINV
jgi:hypothetical protein